MIEHGRVRVNGELIRELGTKADPDNDHIQVDGKPLRSSKAHLYLMLNKPADASPRARTPKAA